MSDDPFPDAPSYEELEEMRADPEEFDDPGEYVMENREWYNEAVLVGARLIVEAAREYPEFKEQVLEREEPGVGHVMADYDEEKHEKLNTMGLSAFQGSEAERLAASELRNND